MILRITSLLALLLGVTHCERLDRYVQHYETLNYNTNDLHSKHERARRSVSGSGEVELDFEAHGRKFNLMLKQGAPYLSRDLIVETDSGSAAYQPDFLYVGHLKDNPDSKIHGGITKGIFQGTIYDGDEEYHVEPAKNHLGGETGDAHSVIYKASDVTHPSDAGCGLNDRVAKWMNKVQNSRDDRHSSRQKREVKVAEIHSESDNRYAAPRSTRTRRAPYDGSRTACSLYLQADHTYTAHYGGDVSEVILNLNNHVSAINGIYTETNFDANGQTVRGINFYVQRIRVNGTAQETDSSNPFRFPNLGVEKFLELNSLQDHSSYCLAYVFADRDFNDGVLGLAWVGATGATSGGICEDFTAFSGVKQSLNTGVVTIQNYGSTVASKVSHITFAHEVGHNFGSPHDFPLRCRPGDDASTRSQGNFIMYASATSGDKTNNGAFSTCSVGNMSQIILENGGCFEPSNIAVCGNLIVNDGEQCDCGYEDQCNDQCCDANTCMLRAGVCSPSQGPCCTTTCQFDMSGKQCRPDSECAEASSCDYISAACPVSRPKSDGSVCNMGTQVCQAGECQGSLCPYFGLEECFCADKDTTKDLDEGCHICCMDQFGMCLSSYEIPSMMNHTYTYGEDKELSDGSTVTVLLQMPGAPCNEYQGYCDVFSICRNVDSNGPLSRLTNAIFNPELYSDIASWIQANWWAAVLIVLGVIIFMGLFIKICSVHTPSSNPNMPKARKVSVPATLRRRHHQPAGGRGGQDIAMA